jgi:hypothetical protein
MDELEERRKAVEELKNSELGLPVEGEIAISEHPKMSQWQCHIVDNFCIVPQDGSHPNWFWRKMQYVILGFKWKKSDE